MNILVKFQPDIPILMVMGGRSTRYGPEIGVPVKSSQVEKGEKLPPNPETIMVNPQRKLYGLKH
jgi:hypothetical protein